MKTYHFESIIQDNGCIVLPVYMENLKAHRVKLTVEDMDTNPGNPLNILADITRRYSSITEVDLDIDAIYRLREENYDRGIVFD